MDRIDELMTAADPARDVPGPRPFRLAEIAGPWTAAATGRPRRRDHVIVWGGVVGVAAAVVGGLIVASQWQSTPETPAQPAGPDSAAPTGPTEPPGTRSPEPTASPTSVPTALPNGLVPAHDEVYVEDSEACRALDVTQVLTDGGQTLATEPWEYPVVGCVDGIAALSMSDRWFYTADVDDVAMGIVLARWEDGRWAIEDPQELSDGTVSVPLYHSWPALLGYRLPGDPPAAERMAEQYAQIGVDAETGERLLGPETVAWTVDTPAESWSAGTAGPATFSWRSDAAWEHQEFAGASGGGGADDVRHVVAYFDPHSKSVAQLMTTTWQPEQPECVQTDATYVVEGRETSQLESELGPLDVGLVTSEDALGVEVSITSLVPASAPDSGAWCDLPESHTVGDVVVQLDGGRYQFRSADERADYLASQEFADIVRLATSITID